MTCYISLLLYRLLEKKLGDAYTVSQILGTLRSMQMTLLNTASGYIPSYTRTELTDSLHKTFGFRTDYEFITKASMRICKVYYFIFSIPRQFPSISLIFPLSKLTQNAIILLLLILSLTRRGVHN